MSLRRISIFPRTVLSRGKDPELTEKPKNVQVGLTKFRKVKKEKKTDAGRNQASHERKMEEWKRFAAVLNPPLKKIERTEEEIEEAKRQTLTYSREKLRRANERRYDESLKIMLRDLAIEQLPTEELKTKAREVDNAPFPQHMVWATHQPPLEGENIFGDYQKPGRFPDVDEKGAPPVLYKPPKI